MQELSTRFLQERQRRQRLHNCLVVSVWGPQEGRPERAARARGATGLALPSQGRVREGVEGPCEGMGRSVVGRDLSEVELGVGIPAHISIRGPEERPAQLRTRPLLSQELQGNIRVHCRIRPALPTAAEPHDPVSHGR